jgi:hypothetical protein
MQKIKKQVLTRKACGAMLGVFALLPLIFDIRNHEG